MTENSYGFTGWSCWVAKRTRIFVWCEKAVLFGCALQATAGLRRPKKSNKANGQMPRLWDITFVELTYFVKQIKSTDIPT